MISHLPAYADRPAAVSRFRRFVLRHPGLKPRQRLVALLLLEALNLRSWVAAPSYSQLAREAGVTVRTIGRILRHLNGLGLFRWKRHRRAPSNYMPNLALVDSRYSAPTGEAVNDRPYGIGNRRDWRSFVLLTASASVVHGRPMPSPPDPLPPEKLPPLRLSAAAIASYWRGRTSCR